MDHFDDAGQPNAPIVEGEVVPLAGTEEGSQGSQGGNGEGNGGRMEESNRSETAQPVLTPVVRYPNATTHTSNPSSSRVPLHV
jgi:hypothetical protein